MTRRSSGTTRGRTAILAGVLLLWGCASPPTPLPEIAASPPGPYEREYRIRIGDHLTIRHHFDHELSEDLIVRPDGRISLPLIPEVTAAGLTPDELGRHLEGLYGAELREPRIAVILRNTTRRAFIDGEVEEPGVIELDGPMTVLQALARAGGATDRARLEQVLLIRSNGETYSIYELDLVNARLGGAVLGATLMPDDVVYVPLSRIAEVNRWMKQYVIDNLPVSVGLRPF